MAPNRGQRAGAPWFARLVVAAAAVAGVMVVAAVLGGAAFQPPAPSDGLQDAGGVPWHHVVLPVLCAPLVTLWCYGACRRCTDRFVQRCLVGICALCLFWILDTLVKYPATGEGLVRALWYLFYIPIIFIPLLCSNIALHLAQPGRRWGMPRYRRVTTAVSVALVALVFTNDCHHLVFVLDYGSASWDRDYGYGPGYAAIFAWIVVSVSVCLAAVLSTARRGLRRAVGFLLVPLGVIGAYALCYALRIEPVFSSGIALVNTVLIVATFEAALDLGLLPVQRRQQQVFRLLPFKLEIVDDAGRTCYRTDAAENDPSFGSLDSHIHFEITPLSAGYSILEKDTTLLDRKADELKRVHQRLESQHELLQAEYGIDGRVRVQQSLEDLYDEVSQSIAAGVQRAAGLLEQLPEQREEFAGGGTRRAMLAEARLLLGACKQKGACIIDARRQHSFSGDYLKLLYSEAEANLRSVGVDCAVVDQKGRLTAHQLCVLIDELYGWACAVLASSDAAIVAHVGGGEGGGRLRLLVECPDPQRAIRACRRLQGSLGEEALECVDASQEAAVIIEVRLPEQPADDRGARTDDAGDAIGWSAGQSPIEAAGAAAGRAAAAASAETVGAGAQ